MRRYIIYCLTIITLLFVTGCSLDTLEPDSNVNRGNEEVIIMGRVTRFTDCSVATRGPKEGDESIITSLATAIFEVDETNNTLGKCVYYRYEPNQSDLMVPIEREGYIPNGRYAIYLFANMPGMDNESLEITDETISTLKLEALLNVCKNVENINIPENGIPMMGSLGDTFSTIFDQDGHEFVMSPEENGNITAPKIDGGEPQSMLTIPMKALYAKINFSIQVIPDQSIEGNNPPQFTISGYTVNNIPKSVDFNNTTNADEGDVEVIETLEGNAITGNIYASGTNKIEFSFYLPENLVTPATSWENYKYPFRDENGTIREEDKKYRQRYKSKLLGENQKATNVVISGIFRDHQGHFFDVDYTIHLGADEYGDFNIKRNYEYNNIVTIRGIQASDEQTNTNKVFIDHRVNIEYSQPGIISIHREVLLDSHFEIRPLRIKKNNIGIEVANAVKVEVLNPTGDTGTKWMRLERSLGLGTNAYGKTNASGESIYITEEGASKGKRRYFTYNLVSGSTPGTYDYPLNNSYEVVVPLTDLGECVWVYVDECTDKGDGVRSGTIKVTYGNATFNDNGVPTSEFDSLDGNEAVAYPPIEYQLNQRKLFNVIYEDEDTGEKRPYAIEYHEEYLHSYDAADDYLQTQYEGMKWGLDGIQLSYDHNALFFESGIGLFDFIINIIKSIAGVNPKYDFYIRKHDTSVSDDAEKHSYNGYEFSNEIIQEINGASGNDKDKDNDIDVLALNEEPKSAIEYCYNKNKRNAEGHVVWQNSNGNYNTENLNWYLPAIDEIEDIVMSEYEAEDGSTYKTYGRFLEFQEKYYWSSQPSYIRNHALYRLIIQVPGKYYYDDVNYARSTRVVLNNNEYTYEKSGVNSDYHALEVRGANENDVTLYTTGIYNNGWYNDIVLGTIIRESGNKPRNSMARVRCVRRQSDQQQQ